MRVSGKRPSVAFINNFRGPTMGGGEVQLLTLVAGLTAHHVDVTVVCVAGSALESSLSKVAGVKVIPTDFARWFLPPFAAGIASQVRGVSIVQGTGFLTNLVARRIGPRVRASVINTAHVMPGSARQDGASTASSIARFVLDRASRHRVDRFVAVSEAVAKAIAADAVDPRKIVVIPNGVNVARLQAAAARMASVDIPEGVLVGFVGRLRRVKGCEVFLRAAALIAAQRPDIRFVIAGAGTGARSLRALATELGLDDRARFVGYVDPVAPVLGALDVVVVPSLSEAFGLSAIEALALRIPVVASRVGGLTEIIIDEQTGLLVPVGDERAIAGSVLRLLDDKDLANRLTTEGVQLVEERYTDRRMTEGYLKLYEDVAG